SVSVSCAVVVGTPNSIWIDGIAGMNDDIASGPSAVASTSDSISVTDGAIASRAAEACVPSCPVGVVIVIGRWKSPAMYAACTLLTTGDRRALRGLQSLSGDRRLESAGRSIGLFRAAR